MQPRPFNYASANFYLGVLRPSVRPPRNFVIRKLAAASQIWQRRCSKRSPFPSHSAHHFSFLHSMASKFIWCIVFFPNVYPLSPKKEISFCIFWMNLYFIWSIILFFDHIVKIPEFNFFYRVSHSSEPWMPPPCDHFPPFFSGFRGANM